MFFPLLSSQSDQAGALRMCGNALLQDTQHFENGYVFWAESLVGLRQPPPRGGDYVSDA